MMRSQMSYEVRDYMDEQDKSGLRQALRLIKDLSSQYGLDVAITSLQEVLVRRRTEGITVNAAMIASRIVFCARRGFRSMFPKRNRSHERVK
jgi:hypothetical protein